MMAVELGDGLLSTFSFNACSQNTYAQVLDVTQ